MLVPPPSRLTNGIQILLCRGFPMWRWWFIYIQCIWTACISFECKPNLHTDFIWTILNFTWALCKLHARFLLGVTRTSYAVHIEATRGTYEHSSNSETFIRNPSVVHGNDNCYVSQAFHMEYGYFVCRGFCIIRIPYEVKNGSYVYDIKIFIWITDEFHIIFTH